jgi:preprotein translocase subunit Sec61beta
MAWKQESVSMPMGSAGILGISQGETLAGIQVDPKTIVIGILVFVAIVQIATFVLRISA